MLAAESAWRILTTEHEQMREWLASIERAPDAAALQRLLAGLQAFDLAHRAKGTVLRDALRRSGSGEAAELLDEIEADQRHCEQLLADGLALLAADAGREQLAPILRQHAELRVGHMEREDTALQSVARRWLDEEAWSAVISSMSAGAPRS